jgi:hypothetical protein
VPFIGQREAGGKFQLNRHQNVAGIPPTINYDPNFGRFSMEMRASAKFGTNWDKPEQILSAGPTHMQATCPRPPPLEARTR